MKKVIVAVALLFYIAHGMEHEKEQLIKKFEGLENILPNFDKNDKNHLLIAKDEKNQCSFYKGGDCLFEDDYQEIEEGNFFYVPSKWLISLSRNNELVFTGMLIIGTNDEKKVNNFEATFKESTEKKKWGILHLDELM